MTPMPDEQPNLAFKDQIKPEFKLSSIFVVEWLYLLLIFSLPFVQPLNFKVSGLIIQVTDVIFLLLFAVFAYTILTKKISLRFSRFYYLLGFYALALGLSAVFSAEHRTSLIKYITEFYLFFLLIITFTLVRSTVFFKKVALVWIAATSIVSLMGVLTVLLYYVAPENALLSYTLHHYGTLIPGHYPRIQVTYYYPAMLCHYLSIGLMLLFIARKNEWITWRIFIFIMPLLLLTLFFTLTPGLGGIVLSISLWLWIQERDKSRKAFLYLSGGIFLAIICILVTAVSPIQTETSPYFIKLPVIEKRLDPSVRLLTWQSALTKFSESPLVGKGIGVDAADVYYKDASRRLQFLQDAHQIWLNVAAQSGIFGLIAITLIAFYFVRRGLPKHPFDSPEKTILTGLTIAFISAFIYQGLIGSFEEARQLWILMGLLLSAEQLAERAE